MTPAISIKKLTKIYANNLIVLDKINLDIKKGDFFALLGSNGAGKTTAIGIISGLINPSSGYVEICGLNQSKNINKVKRKIGLMPQEFNFNPYEPIIEILVNSAGYFGIDKKIATNHAEKLLKRVDLWDRRLDQPKSLSGGMRRKVMLARSLMHNPEILILDEPTAGIDIESRKSMWDFLKILNKEGLTIVLTTHYLEDAESMCKNIAILDKGRIIENSSMAKLLKKNKNQILILDCIEDISKNIKIKNCDCKVLGEKSLQITIPNSMTISDVITQLLLQNINVHSFSTAQNRLEQLFLSITKKNK